MANIYSMAWKLLLKRIERKTSWGKEELKNLMLQCFIDADFGEEKMYEINVKGGLTKGLIPKGGEQE